MFVAPRGGGFNNPTGIDRRQRLSVFFPFIASQSQLDPAFRSECPRCGSTTVFPGSSGDEQRLERNARAAWRRGTTMAGGGGRSDDSMTRCRFSRRAKSRRRHGVRALRPARLLSDTASGLRRALSAARLVVGRGPEPSDGFRRSRSERVAAAAAAAALAGARAAGNYFLTGIVVAAPIGITIYITWSFVHWVDSRVKPLIPNVYNPDHYLPFSVPGVGLSSPS